MEIKGALQKKEATISERFAGMVQKEFGSEVGLVKFDAYHQRLVQHLYIKVDTVLKELEAKRLSKGDAKNGVPIVWQNINMAKLAIDAVHRVQLGLDALIPNHIHPIPYLNGRTKKYDLDLRIGYAGKDCYYRAMALDQPKEIIYELVYSTDKFIPRKKSLGNPNESYEFEITQPFDRGEVIGGFGYVMYEDPAKNRLILVTKKDFEKSKSKGNTQFWGPHEENMQWKTIVHRTVGKIALDPMKINGAFLAVEQQENESMDERIELQINEEIREEANSGDVVDVEFVDADISTPEDVPGDPVVQASNEPAPAGPDF